MPRTPDGRPDLQGNWTSATLTPLQRPEGQGPVLTWEEVERREQAPELAPAFDGLLIREVAEPSDPNRPPAPARGSVYGIYENVYTIAQSDRVAIVDGEPRSSLVTNPPDGRIPPRTPEGERRAAEYRELRRQFGQYDHPELRPLTERCLMSQGSSAGPPMLPNYPGWYNNNYTIVQTADHVLIMAEMVHDARIIRIGSGPRFDQSSGFDPTDPEPIPELQFNQSLPD